MSFNRYPRITIRRIRFTAKLVGKVDGEDDILSRLAFSSHDAAMHW